MFSSCNSCDIFSSTLPLIFKSIYFIKAILLSFLCSLSFRDDAVKQTFFVLKICACLRPRNIRLMTLLDINNPGKVLQIGMDNARHFVGNSFFALFRLAVHLEHVHGCWLRFTVRQQHFVIHSPVLVVLL